MKNNRILAYWPSFRDSLVLELCIGRCPELICLHVGWRAECEILLGGSDVDEVTEHGCSIWELFLSEDVVIGPITLKLGNLPVNTIRESWATMG